MRIRLENGDEITLTTDEMQSRAFKAGLKSEGAESDPRVWRHLSLAQKIGYWARRKDPIPLTKEEVREALRPKE